MSDQTLPTDDELEDELNRLTAPHPWKNQLIIEIGETDEGVIEHTITAKGGDIHKWLYDMRFNIDLLIQAAQNAPLS